VCLTIFNPYILWFYTTQQGCHTWKTVPGLSSAPIQNVCETELGIWRDTFKMSVCVLYLAQYNIIKWTWWHNAYQNMYRKWLNIRWDVAIYLCMYLYLKNMFHHSWSICTLSDENNVGSLWKVYWMSKTVQEYLKWKYKQLMTSEKFKFVYKNNLHFNFFHYLITGS